MREPGSVRSRQSAWRDTGVLTIEVAGIVVAIAGLDEALVREASSRYVSFLSDKEPVLFVSATTSCVKDCPVGHGKDAEARVESDLARPGAYVLERMDLPSTAIVDLPSGLGTVSLPATIDCLDGFLALLFSVLLLEDSGVLMRAVCVSLEGRGVLLIGEPGRGKFALEHQGFASVISDRIVAVTRDKDAEYRVWGTPFASAVAPTALNEPAPLMALYVTRDGRATRVKVLPTDAALFQVLSYTFFFGPAQRSRAICDFVAGITADKLSGELEWVPSPEVVVCLQNDIVAAQNAARAGASGGGLSAGPRGTLACC